MAVTQEIDIQVHKPKLVKSRLTITHQVPSHAKVKVKAGDVVTPDTKIAEYETSWGYRILHMAAELNVKGSDVSKSLLKQVGGHIYQKEPLAVKKSLFKKKTYASPIDGVIQAVGANGDVTVSMPPEHITQASLYWGKVKEVIASEQQIQGSVQAPQVSSTITVVVETCVLSIIGALGSGQRREGRITVASDAGDFLLPQRLEEAWENCIIVGGALLEHGVLQKALRLSASGIITGGIHVRDAMGIGIRPEGSVQVGTDVGITIVATEGFGAAAMSEEQFAMLVHFNGRYGVLNGNTATLDIPLKEDEFQSLEVSEPPKDPATTVPLKSGMKVRIVSGNDFGRVGTVTAITEDGQLASGIRAPMVTVELKTAAPAYNIMQLQTNNKRGIVDNQPQPASGANENRPAVSVSLPAANIEAVL